MDMMKDMYDDGDDNMKKIIGEAMYKARKGEKYDPKDKDMPAMDEKEEKEVFDMPGMDEKPSGLDSMDGDF